MYDRIDRSSGTGVNGTGVNETGVNGLVGRGRSS